MTKKIEHQRNHTHNQTPITTRANNKLYVTQAIHKEPDPSLTPDPSLHQWSLWDSLKGPHTTGHQGGFPPTQHSMPPTNPCSECLKVYVWQEPEALADWTLTCTLEWGCDHICFGWAHILSKAEFINTQPFATTWYLLESWHTQHHPNTLDSAPQRTLSISGLVLTNCILFSFLP